MGYTLIKAFERGIDTRKLIDTIEAGSLLDARNCHVTLGGEIEKRAAFVTVATLPDTTVGLYVTEGRVLHTWGDAATAPAGMPPNSVYHSIPDPDGSPLAHILTVEEFSGELYVVAQYEDNHVIHWWKGPVLNPPPGPDSGGDPGGGGTPPDTTPGSKPQVTFQLQILFPTADPLPDVTITAIYLMAPSVTTPPIIGTNVFMLIPTTGVDSAGWPFCDTEVVTGPLHPNQVIAKITNLINTSVQTPVDVSASLVGEDGVRFYVEDANTTYNGWKIQVRLSNMRVNPSNTEALSGGVAPEIITGGLGAPRAGVPGEPSTLGNYVIAHNRRMWSVQDTQLNFSEEKDPMSWVNNDSGPIPVDNFIDMSMETQRRPELMSLAEYRSDLAIFARRQVIVYHMDFVLPQSFKRFVLQGTGTFAPRSVTPFGEGEVMYLDISGIRSLKARDSTDMGFAADIGNMIDELVKQTIAADTPDQRLYNYWGQVEPRSGRLWMAMHDRIFVLSYYPSSRIAAWTYYDATEAPVDYMNDSDDSVYWRSGNNVICYGDVDGTTYDATEALVRVPYIDAGKPATSKNWTGLDVAIFGTWTVRGSFDPTAPTALDLLATLTKSSYAQQKVAVNGESPGLSLELKSTFVGAAKVGNAAVHYTDSTAD